MEKYDILEKVGECAYGEVYKATEKSSGQLVALKKAWLAIGDEGMPAITQLEISLLKTLNSSIYVVDLLSVEIVENRDGKPSVYLVFEYFDTDLKKFMDRYLKGPNHGSMPPESVMSFCYQLLKGVEYCHSRGVLHGDLKPQNLFLDTEWGLIKIFDFGLGWQVFGPNTNQIVTLWYRAPEVLLGDETTHYSAAVDMCSVGCIFAEMVNGRVLFRGDSEDGQLKDIFKMLGTPTEKEWPGVTLLRNWHVYPQWEPQNLAGLISLLEPEGIDLLSKMLKCNPADRISAKVALNHPYFDSLDKSQF